ncbi:hypothetical protein PINS_up001407 [Pythium insidiosum]|nr:hypothetical protein PINS_up001407 [Pythium insidiosum]
MRSIDPFVQLVAFAMSLGVVAARQDFSALVPNGAAFEDRPIGYVSTADDSPLDSFGKALEAAGRAWTLSLCKGDADGDGQTNGVELGDPCCLWTGKAPPMGTAKVSNPGDEYAKLDGATIDEYLRICQAIDTFLVTSVPNSSWTTIVTVNSSVSQDGTHDRNASSRSSAKHKTTSRPKRSSTVHPSPQSSHSASSTSATGSVESEEVSSDIEPSSDATPSASIRWIAVAVVVVVIAFCS